MVFNDRKGAGKLLAHALKDVNLSLSRGLVLALPRGGVLVAREITASLKLPLDIIVTRKIGAPHNSEFALAAIDEDGILTGDENQLKFYSKYLKDEASHQKKEIKRRLKTYRNEEKHPELRGKEVILVDDGIATGQTMTSAIRFAKRKGARKVYVATPVLPADTVEEIQNESDGLFYLYAPESFWAVGQFYADFPQVTDEEVVAVLSEDSSGRKGKDKAHRLTNNPKALS